jgi:hypothetical protein
MKKKLTKERCVVVVVVVVVTSQYSDRDAPIAGERHCNIEIYRKKFGLRKGIYCERNEKYIKRSVILLSSTSDISIIKIKTAWL